ncbi:MULTISPECIES: L-lactate dehydrogenase [Caloramator]|uniref:L-lactate dehydrogenase n=1 Tax=Caloramator proteoclasticus DSM 10124 TaxID=1121262 RepID=A0A1M4TD42_9CLOT|nr:MULTISPECIES: L-lactate dehydrogenase [Caloramator]SHE42406.1 L-lactate dehydrogenase [Caloramator proteoclasticus DSM 10124]
MKKVSIIGSGFVGSTTAFTIAMNGLAEEIVIIDINKDKAYGDALDISHGVPLMSPVEVYSGEFSDVKDSDIIIITAGANQKPGETRLDLVKKNVSIFKDMIPKLVKYNKDAIYLIVTNPVDILTYVTLKISGLPKNKVIGSGTVLDSSRYKYLLSKHYGIDPRNIHGYIIGEHGDSEIAAWSLTNIAGTSIDYFCNICNHPCNGQFKEQILNDVRNSAYTIINKKGATYYAVAVAVKRIVECIARDEKSILTVSSYLENKYGLKDVALSVPTIVGKNGVEEVLELPLTEQEKNKLLDSANIMKDIISKLEL